MTNLQSVAFKTLGCKVNDYETDILTEIFENANYKVIDFEKQADVYVINTCTVTNLSAKKSRQMIRQAKRRNLDSLVIVVGCYAQQEPKLLLEMDEADLIIGNNNKNKILEYIENYDGKRKEKIIDISKQDKFEDYILEKTLDKTRAFIKIQDGCNEFCTYCIIPHVRGRVRSRKLDSVIKEVKKLRDNGYKEIVFTGIHVTSYGEDLDFKIDLIDLLNKVNKIDGIERLRLSSLEPTFLNEKNIKRLSKVSKLVNHFHLSLQSGSDFVLDRMNRNYKTNQYLKVVKKIRKYFNNPSITTDIIVGFPGETKKEFNETVEFVKKVKFSQVHVFRFSKRDGTKAAKMKNQVNGNISSKRSKILRKLTKKLEKEYIKENLLTTKKVLFETFDKENKIAEGLTKNYLRVYVKSDKDLSNKLIDVHLDFYNNNKIFGSLKGGKDE
ncbi:MAG: tRNA (N(6)-L-threonylcarbamoyladenosine(37)-C(2))-methylthiotransferase MtaB [Bacillota bacterium]